jgi:CubicO group peptidase (beta-lactamase class C family)
MADRERGRPNTTDTIYAIGSVPIDFTKAAILKLAEMGRLRTSDPITKFFAEAPEDKRAVTIDHLMTGRSGLPNFHHDSGMDADPDLTWIDRPTAIRRILSPPAKVAPTRIPRGWCWRRSSRSPPGSRTGSSFGNASSRRRG